MTGKEKLHQILSSLWKNDDSVGKTYYNQALQDVQTAIDLQEEPVSEGLEDALAREWQGYNDRGAATVDALEDNTQELTFAKGFYRGAQWQKQQMMEDAVDGKVLVNGMGNPILHLWDKGRHLIDKKVKIIVIKED